MREISSPLDGFASPFGPQRGFNPLRIFANDEPGVWFEANDSTTLFTDVAGTTPVTTPGDAVALQLDKSQGLTLGPELVTNGTFDTDTTGWTANAAASIAAAGGRLRLTADSNTAVAVRAGYNFTTEVGKAYLFNVSNTYIATGAGLPTFNVRTGHTVGAGDSLTPFTVITGEYFFVATTTQAHIELYSGTDAIGEYSEFDNISVRELPGNHRTQATTAARPLYALHPVGGVRNLLQYTEEFDNAVWSNAAATVTANATTAPNGTITADTLEDASTGYSILTQGVDYSSTSTASFYVKKDAIGRATRFPALRIQYSGTSTQFYDIYFDTSTGEYSLSAGASGDVIDAGDYWRVWVSGTDTGSNTVLEMRVFPAIGASSVWTPSPTATGSIVAWGAQVEEGSTATNYQRVGSFLDVSEEGVARRGRLWYNGTSHFMQTGTITPGTDKVQVFAGVRKLGTSTAIIAETGTNATIISGTIAHFSDGSSSANGYGAVRSMPGGLDAVNVASLFPAPSTNVNTVICDEAGDSLILRVDGVQRAISQPTIGGGNFSAYPLYFGARAGTSLFFNGYEDTSIIRFGPNLDDTTISNVESYVASKTPEPTL